MGQPELDLLPASVESRGYPCQPHGECQDTRERSHAGRNLRRKRQPKKADPGIDDKPDRNSWSQENQKDDSHEGVPP